MFKKPLGNLKTSAPLRSSDRRKLKQRIVEVYKLTPEEGDALVPDGILSVKFITHVESPGTAYLDPNGNPVWFSLGKGSEELLPTIYTLWKKEDLLPSLSTPAAVIPILVGGADLMIPGVIHCPPSLSEHQLVSIRQYVKKDGSPALSAPLALGRMALPSNELKGRTEEKGKAVHIVHTWKDHFWDMGSKCDPPEDTIMELAAPVADEDSSEGEDTDKESDEESEDGATPPPASETVPSPTSGPSDPIPISYSPQEVTELLNKALVQAISKALPSSALPIPATLLYQTYILPNRPAFPSLILPPTSNVQTTDSSGDLPRVDTEITIKSSSHKSLTTFLKAAEKTGLITLKPPQKLQPDVMVTAVNMTHPIITSHTPFATVKDVEATAAKKAARDDGKAADSVVEVEAVELLMPNGNHQATGDLFEAMGAKKDGLYTAVEVREFINTYVENHKLVNENERAYINLDDHLSACIAAGRSKPKNKDVEPEPLPQFMKRGDLVKKVVQKMQSWYEIRVPGKDLVRKKGTLAPIQVVTKVRQGRKTATLISGFEPFIVIKADEMADELRKTCAGATSISPIQGKANGGSEVLVQGKQVKAVVAYLMAKGIPKNWIETSGK